MLPNLGSVLGGGGGGLGSPLVGFSPNTRISFLAISPKLLDIWPFFLLVFSPIKTALLLILFKLSGDGYALLCSSKSSFRGTPRNLAENHSPSITSFRGKKKLLPFLNIEQMIVPKP